MFDSMVKEILDQVGGLSSQNTELCSLLRNILQVLLLLCICGALAQFVHHSFIVCMAVWQIFPHPNRGSKDRGCHSLYRL